MSRRLGRLGKEVKYSRVIMCTRPLTMARWKSGLFPLVVLAIRVNCDTHSTSPEMSFTLFFHMTPLASENTRKDKLERMGVKRGLLVSQRGCLHLIRQGVHISKGIIYLAEGYQKFSRPMEEHTSSDADQHHQAV